MCKRSDKDEKTTQRIKRVAHERELKNLSARDERQKKNHCQKKEIELQKILRKIHQSDDHILTINTLSENAKSSIKKDFKDIEFDSEKQHKNNFALNQQFRKQNEHIFKTILLEHRTDESQRHARFSLSRNRREIDSTNF